MPNTVAKSSEPKSKGNLALIAIVIVILGAALWARFHFMANAASFNKYMDGVRLMQAGNETEAVSIWEELRMQDPSYPDTYYALATYYTNSGQPQESLSILDAAKANHVDTPDLKVALAEAYVRLNDKRAVDAAKEAVKVEPDNYRSHLALATAYAQGFDEPHTVQELQKAENDAPNKAALYLLGAEYYSTANDYANTEAQARKCVQLSPGVAEAWYYIGWALSSGSDTSRLTEASDALKKSISLNANSFDAWLQLGDVMWRLRKTVDACTDLEKARELGSVRETNESVSDQRLQERIKADHLLIEVYTAQGKTAQVAAMHKESEQLSTELQSVQQRNEGPGR